MSRLWRVAAESQYGEEAPARHAEGVPTLDGAPLVRRAVGRCPAVLRTLFRALVVEASVLCCRGECKVAAPFEDAAFV